MCGLSFVNGITSWWGCYAKAECSKGKLAGFMISLTGLIFLLQKVRSDKHSMWDFFKHNYLRVGHLVIQLLETPRRGAQHQLQE